GIDRRAKRIPRNPPMKMASPRCPQNSPARKTQKIILMKTFLKLALSTLALGLAAAAGARAEDTTVTVPIAPTASPETPAGKGAGKAGGKRVRDQIAG